MPKGKFKTDKEILKRLIEAQAAVDAEGTEETPESILSDLLVDINDFLDKSKDAIKGKTGSPAIRAFLREVKTKLQGMIKSVKEASLINGVNDLMEKIDVLESGNPVGSFEDIRQNVQDALNAHPMFKAPSDKPWNTADIRYLYADHAIVRHQSLKLYNIPYSMMDGKTTLGEPKQVEEKTIIKPLGESEVEPKSMKKIEKVSEVKESCYKVTDLKESKEVGELEDFVFVSLKEASVSSDGSEVEVILIESGFNPMKRRLYPEKTIMEAAPYFKGLKNYINHPTKAEETARPERDLRDWASTLTESWGTESNGKAQARGKVSIHDTWLRERMKDPVFRANVGLSINAGGKVSSGKVNGEDAEIVEKIVFARKNGPVSVDWVTEPGARGRVAQLLESRTKEKPMLENLTVKELKEARADIVESIVKDATKDVNEKLAAAEKSLQEANDRIAGFEKSSKISNQMSLVESIINKDGIPEATKAIVREHFASVVIEGDEKAIKESITARLEKELDYVAKVTGKGKIKIGGSKNGDASLIEKYTKDLAESARLKDEPVKKEEDDEL